jgi:redox-sensitive bicupin YhaK (pirin superfamily)
LFPDHFSATLHPIIFSMKTIFHPSSQRGHADHGWLNARHSFSFASWHDPSKVHFGALRVLNDDIIAAGMGFGTHPHDNMEIVTIPLSGAVSHRDSMGNDGIINAGDVQIMSAGTGVQHSEVNASKTEALNLLQIWVFPKVENIKPRYEQKTFDLESKRNSFVILVSPDREEESLWINQDACFIEGLFDAGQNFQYKIRHSGNGAYVFIIDGEVKVGDQICAKKDGIGISETDAISFETLAPSRILVIEIPMVI